MKILFLFFAILLFTFQAIPGYAYPSSDTLECRRSGGFCKRYSCPGITERTGGTCEDGFLICCKRPYRDGRVQ